MKRLALLITVLLCVLLCAFAQAETFTFGDFCATLTVAESDYILLTPDNLSLHEEWVAAEGTTVEALQAEWQEDGVLLVADELNGNYRIVISAEPDSENLYDLDQHTTQVRSAYAARYSKGTKDADGITTWQGGTWKLRSSYGRFLIIKYKQTEGETTLRRGYLWRAIRNGYIISCDYQVTGRGLRDSDGTIMENFMKGFTFTETKEKPSDCVQLATFSEEPPVETSTGKFTVSGTCEEGLTVTGVVMKMSSSERVVYEAVADKKGRFSIDVVLPSEGMWLMTATVSNGDTVVQEEVFEVTTFDKTTIPVNITTEVPAQLTGDELVIKGTTIKGIKIQCLMNDTYSRTVTTNGTGAFTFKLDVSKEGDYDITLVFSKKGYDTRRYTYHCTHTLTAEETKENLAESAVKPAYSTLTKKLEAYTGRVMRYNLYIVETSQVGDQWLVRCAMKQSKTGKYSDLVVVLCDEDPGFANDTLQTMVGTCIGAYTTSDGETTDSVPGFELLFWE